jgi:hypothetical protein
LVEAGLLTGKTIAIDATTLEANAAMRSHSNETLLALAAGPFAAAFLSRHGSFS